MRSGSTDHWLLITRFLGALIILLTATQVQAQIGLEMGMSAEPTFGEHITFTARLVPPVPPIQKASILIYDSTQAITHSQPVTFDPNGVSEFRFDTRQNSLRPFTTVLWRYEITLADGSTSMSQTSAIRYDDDRFAWQMLESDALRIHWYAGDEQFGVAALNAGQAGLQSIRNLFPPDLSQPVDVFIYANEDDLRGTLYASDAWVAGHADSPAGVIMVTIEPGPGQGILMEQRIPHELMHVMMYRQVGAGYGNVPAWLREGIPMLAEVYPNPDYDTVLRDAAARDALIPMRDLCASFSPRIDSAFLAYAQSRSFTGYLRGQYGMDGLLTLAAAYADGVDCERGPERAFGVSLAKLDLDWRQSVLGQDALGVTLGNMAPYLVLLCLVLLIPIFSILSTMKRKGNHHGPETFVR
jgi:hypothetical protein